MFNNLGLHLELISPLSAVLLIVGGVLGYGSKYILKLLKMDTSEMTVVSLKTVGLVLVIVGVLLIFL